MPAFPRQRLSQAAAAVGPSGGQRQACTRDLAGSFSASQPPSWGLARQPMAGCMHVLGLTNRRKIVKRRGKYRLDAYDKEGVLSKDGNKY